MKKNSYNTSDLELNIPPPYQSKGKAVPLQAWGAHRVPGS